MVMFKREYLLKNDLPCELGVANDLYVAMYTPYCYVVENVVEDVVSLGYVPRELKEKTFELYNTERASYYIEAVITALNGGDTEPLEEQAYLMSTKNILRRMEKELRRIIESAERHKKEVEEIGF